MSFHDEVTTSIAIANRKRTREDSNDSIDLDRRPFTIQPDPCETHAQARVFTPVCLLSRESLPFALLDTAHTGSRIFSAHIAVLEACNDFEEGSNVLIAHEQVEQRLYAIERTKRHVYALCRLADSVTRGRAEDLAHSVSTAPLPRAKRNDSQPFRDEAPWWASATIDMSDVFDRQSTGIENQIQLQVWGEKSVILGADPAPEETRAERVTVGTETFHSQQLRPPKAEATDTAPLASQNRLEELTNQYLDTLYLSRTSLAYFVKGPLSRARTALAGSDGTTKLVQFLRQAILSTAVLDVKFKDGIRELTKNLPLESPEQSSKHGRQRKWKPKRDKAGFFSTEKLFVEKWWRRQDTATDAPDSVETVDAAWKRRIPELRNREAFLQVILILEVFALEATLPKDADREAETHDQTFQSAARGKSRKTKKGQDLVVLLDTLIDRLCIWYSLQIHSPAKQVERPELPRDCESKDELKDFCIEIVIPFFMSRIPQNAAAVNSKLGGPSAPSPTKWQKAALRKPGMPAPRESKRNGRSLDTAVSKDAPDTVASAPPVLHRSATDPAGMVRIKRESGDASLNTIPPVNLHPRKRTSLIHTISTSKREVDLSVMSQGSEAKLRKKEEIKQKLREAIATLKKPNRALAVKEASDRLDESLTKPAAKVKIRQLQRAKTVAHGVDIEATPKQIQATPHPQRKRHTIYDQGSVGAAVNQTSTIQQVASVLGQDPPSTFAIPETGRRPRQKHAAVETPSRGLAKLMKPDATRNHDSPVPKSYAVHVEQTPLRPIRSLSFPAPTTAPPTTSPPDAIGLNRTDTDAVAKDEAKSIYETLGWNEDYQELV